MHHTPWSVLSDTRPLAPGDKRYVPRPWGGGDRLAVLVENGLSPIAVTGPSGSGKTTELNHAARVLGDGNVFPLLLRVDTLMSLADPTPGLVLYVVAEAMLDRVIAQDPGLVPSKSVIEDIRSSDPRLARGKGLARSPSELLAVVHAEIQRLLGHHGQVALLLDGLDRVPAAVARAAVEGFLDVKDVLPIIVVVDPELATGPASRRLLTRYRVFGLPALPVGKDANGVRGFEHLAGVLRARLNDAYTEEYRSIAFRAAEKSGGLVRTFCEILADAASYAAIGGSAGPTAESLTDAIRDRADNLRRLLQDGDAEALSLAAGSDGLEIEIARRVRFLSQGLLLEYADGEDTIVRPHPLLDRVIEKRLPKPKAPRKSTPRKPKAK
jgi:hypothetical protein